MLRKKELGKRIVSVFSAACLAVAFTVPASALEAPAGGDDAAQAPAASEPAPADAEDTATSDDAPGYEEGELIVTYDNAKDGSGEAVSGSSVKKKLESEGVSVDKTLASADSDGGSVVKASFDGDEDVEAMAKKVRKLPGVKAAQPNFTYHLLEGGSQTGSYTAGPGDVSAEWVPDDPVANVSSGADKTVPNQYYLYGDTGSGSKGANVLEAWDHARSDGSVTVAVLDTGVDLTHPDLQANVLTDYAWDAFHNAKLESTSTFCGDYAGHGTHVCGIISATAGNGLGIAGASANAKVLPIKVFNDSSTQATCSTSTLVQAYNYLDDLMEEGSVQNLHAINMSLGGYSSIDSTDTALEKLIKEFRDEKNIVTVCAGGNGDSSGNPLTTNQYPSDFDESFAVTALDVDGTNATWSDYNSKKNISAPGVSMWSTWPKTGMRDGIAYNDDGTYYCVSGTSMASPLVAGIVALCFAANPDATADEVIKAIQDTADPVDDGNDPYKRNSTGATGSAGAINAAKAVEKVTNAQISLPEGFDQFYRTEKVQLTPSIRNVDEPLQWTWSVTNGTGSASVSDDGTVTALTAGSVQVNVSTTYGGREYSATHVFDIHEIGLPNAPAATQTFADAVSLSWEGARAATQYRVERAAAGSGDFQVLGTTAETSYEDATAADSELYDYRVVPIGAFEDGAEAEGAASATARGVRFDMVSSFVGQDQVVKRLQAAGAVSGTSIDTAVVVSKDDPATAELAAGIAGVYHAVVYATSSASLDADVAASLSDVAPQRVIVIGGTSAVSDDAYQAIKAAAPRADVNRYSEESPYLLAETLYGIGRGSWGKVAFLIAGDGDEATYQNTLAVGAYAYAAQGPIFMTKDSETLSLRTRQNLAAGAFSKIVIVGDEDQVGTGVEETLKKSALSYERVNGGSLYATGSQLMKDAVQQGALDDGVYIFASPDLATSACSAALAGSLRAQVFFVDEGHEDALAGNVAPSATSPHPVMFVSAGEESSLSDAEKGRIVEYAHGGDVTPGVENVGTSIAQATVSPIEAQTYTGSAIEPPVTVTLDGAQLVAGTDYVVSYAGNTEVGQATITVRGIGAYTGKVTATFTIKEKSSSDNPSDPDKPGKPTDPTIPTDSDSFYSYTPGRGLQFEIAALADQDYTGEQVRPKVSVSYKGTELSEGDQYTVDYADNVESGTGVAIVKGSGSFAGVIRSMSFKIVGPSEEQVTALAEDISNSQHLASQVSVSVDGTDLPTTTAWVTQADIDALDSAIDQALAVKGDARISVAKIKAAEAALDKANSAFLAAVSQGTKKADTGQPDEPVQPDEPALPAVGSTVSVGSGAAAAVYTVTAQPGEGTEGTVYFQKAGSPKLVRELSIPVHVQIGDASYRVVGISARALSNCPRLSSVTVPSTVTVIGVRAFAGSKKLRSLTVKTKKLTKASVKGSLKGSSVRTVKVPKAKKTAYKKLFTKANCGKKVTVKAL